MVMAEYRVL